MLEPLRILHVSFSATDHVPARRPANMGTTPFLRLMDDGPDRTQGGTFAEIDARYLKQQPALHKLPRERRVHVPGGSDTAQSVHRLVRPAPVGRRFQPVEKFERCHCLPLTYSEDGVCATVSPVSVAEQAARVSVLELRPRPPPGPFAPGSRLRFLVRAGRDHGARAPFGVDDLHTTYVVRCSS